MLSIDNPSIIRAVHAVFSIEVLYAVDDFLQELFLHRLMHKDIVRSNTSLSVIHEFPPHNPFRCPFHIRRLIDDSWTFSTKLQCHRRQALRSCLHDDFPYSGASCEKDIIERRMDKRRGFFDSAFDDLYKILWINFC